MNIGDRVRVLHSTEEGIITKIIDSKTVEIEIEDGFSFPVLISDLVQVNTKEDEYFSKDERKESDETKNVPGDRGIFLALELTTDEDNYRLHLLNNTDLDILCTVFKKAGKLKYEGLFRGLIKSQRVIQVSEFNTSKLPSFSDLYCQVLHFDNRQGPLRPPIERQVRLASLLATGELTQVAVIGKTAWIKQLDDQDKQHNADIKEAQEGSDDFPPTVIDLHAEVLGLDNNKLSSGEIIDEQLKAFNKALDNALIHGLPEITFIHGVGQGILRKRIIKEIRSRKEVRYWEDAHKEKFGYGGTKVVL